MTGSFDYLLAKRQKTANCKYSITKNMGLLVHIFPKQEFLSRRNQKTNFIKKVHYAFLLLDYKFFFAVQNCKHINYKNRQFN